MEDRPYIRVIAWLFLLLVVALVVVAAINTAGNKTEPSKVTEPPAVAASAAATPVAAAPVAEAPATEEPATEEPATEAPATEAPVTEAPATDASATEPSAVAPDTAARLTLAEYGEQAKELAAKLDVQQPDAVYMATLNDMYKEQQYDSAYGYYFMNRSMMYKSCWMLNNVGLCMLQLQRNEEALVLYMAILMKAPDSQPESLLNLLIAGHAMGFGPGELLESVNMTPDKFQASLEQKNFSQDTVYAMLCSLCYNIIYMRMEEPSVGTVETTVPDKPDIDALLAEEDPSDMLRVQLEALGDKDEDVIQLLAYFDALLALRGQ